MIFLNKMYLWLLLPAIFAFGSCTSERLLDEAQTQERDGVIYAVNEEEPFTGTIVKFREGRAQANADKSLADIPTNDLEHLLPTKDGLTNGLATYYFESGQIRATRAYVNGEKEGPQKTFHQNGQLATEVTITNGNFEGTHHTYSENGAVKKVMSYRNGEPHGECLAYYSDTEQIQLRQNYCDGIQCGRYEYYFENGQLQVTWTYDENGNEIARKEYTQEGQLKFESIVTNGQQTFTQYQAGKRTRHKVSQDGHVIEEITYWKNGELRLHTIDPVKQGWHVKDHRLSNGTSVLGEDKMSRGTGHVCKYNESGQLVDIEFYNAGKQVHALMYRSFNVGLNGGTYRTRHIKQESLWLKEDPKGEHGLVCISHERNTSSGKSSNVFYTRVSNQNVKGNSGVQILCFDGMRRGTTTYLSLAPDWMDHFKRTQKIKAIYYYLGFMDSKVVYAS